MMESYFGSCTNHGECEKACPKEISIDFIALLNRDYVKAQFKNRKLTGQTCLTTGTDQDAATSERSERVARQERRAASRACPRARSERRVVSVSGRGGVG